MPSISFRGGLVFTPAGREEVDVLVRDGRIAAVGPDLRADEEVDAAGLWVLPGAIDAHVHSRDPGLVAKEDWTTLTEAAAAGGVTTVVDMPNTVPAADEGRLLAEKAAVAEAKAVVDFALWGLIRAGTTVPMLYELARAGAIGYKAFLGYAYRRSARAVTYTAQLDDPDLEPPPDYGTLARLAPELARIRLPLAAHGEDAGVLRALAGEVTDYADVQQARPAVAEAIAVAALAEIAAEFGLRLHIVHLSSAAGLRAAEAARFKGVDLSIETAPQYLFLTGSDAERLGNALRMNPPVREEADRAALREALVEGDIDIVATDHAPHTDDEKFAVPLGACHPGGPGVQTLLLSVLELGRDLGLERAHELVSANPAYRLGLYPRKGAVVAGADADLVLVDPGGETTVTAEAMRSKQKHGVFEGMRFGFAVKAVYSRGELVAAGGEVLGKPGRGRFLRPQPGITAV